MRTEETRTRRIIDMKAEATTEQWHIDKKNKLLEAVREFVLSRRDDIEKDMENFGMLQPVLDHFLEEAEG
ncbi:unnamed protein product [marine sediment metagenome]|uniref:Uncharacterized protein n=1 Tax=marine sediment metagenome TaxID=412755 RepID=X1FVQ3_9ZZZZ